MSNSAIRFLLHISHRLYKGTTFNFVLSTLIFNFVVPEFKSYGLWQFLPSLTGLFSSILGLDPTVPSFEVWSVQLLCKTKPVNTSFKTTNYFERCLGKKLQLSLLCFLAAVVWKQSRTFKSQLRQSNFMKSIAKGTTYPRVEWFSKWIKWIITSTKIWMSTSR